MGITRQHNFGQRNKAYFGVLHNIIFFCVINLMFGLLHNAIFVQSKTSLNWFQTVKENLRYRHSNFLQHI